MEFSAYSRNVYQLHVTQKRNELLIRYRNLFGTPLDNSALMNLLVIRQEGCEEGTRGSSEKRGIMQRNLRRKKGWPACSKNLGGARRRVSRVSKV